MVRTDQEDEEITEGDEEREDETALEQRAVVGMRGGAGGPELEDRMEGRGTTGTGCAVM